MAWTAADFPTPQGPERTIAAARPVCCGAGDKVGLSERQEVHAQGFEHNVVFGLCAEFSTCIGSGWFDTRLPHMSGLVTPLHAIGE